MVDEWRRRAYLISTDKERLDLRVIHEFLTASYWAEGISIENARCRIENSLTFGLYIEDKQIGFARVITDLVAFAYLADVFVVETHRSRGLGKWLVETVLSHPALKDLAWQLATEDAHELYRKHGFTELQRPEIHMERRAERSLE